MDNLESCVGISKFTIKNGYRYSVYENKSVNRLIRDAVTEFGFGEFDPENPFGVIVKPGMTVLLKPNWVLHENMSGMGMDCMITHPTFIIEVVRILLLSKPGKVIIGDAPIQRTKFNQIVDKRFYDKLISIVKRVPLEIVDFRRDKWHEIGNYKKIESEARNLERFIEFDIGKDSLLEEVTLSGSSPFRNTMYNPRELKKTHKTNLHKYLLCKEAFEADIIINLPKLKCHRKTCITAALKNIVGLNGSKAYLPHHRIGGSAIGGDCYPGFAPMKRLAEYFYDCANLNITSNRYTKLAKCGYYALKIHRILGGDDEIEGGWYGNDTVWRMVLDLNRILIYGNLNGLLSQIPQRKVYSLTDCLIAGQSFGPLAPEPINLGCFTFAENSLFADICHSALMNFDWSKIKLLYSGFERFKYPLTGMKPSDLSVKNNGKIYSYEQVASNFGLPFKAPKGWKGYVEFKSPLK